MEKKKDQSIETLRGFAIILMVMAHVIGTTSIMGLKVADDSFWRWLYSLTASFRMPLFTIISGFVYSLRPLKKDKVKSFLKGKARRLLLPMIFVSSLQFIVRFIVPGTNTTSDFSQMWKIFVFSYDQFWFLQAIILVFLTITVLEFFDCMGSLKKWAVCFFVAFLIQVLFPFKINIFSFPGYLYLLPCFILGVGIYRYNEVFKDKKVMFFSGLMFLFGLIIQQLSFFNFLGINMAREGFVGITYGLIANVFFFTIRKENKWLAWLGYYAYGIYLFHVFGQAGSRIIFKALGLSSTPVLFIISLFCGLLIPIVMEYFIEKSRVSRFLLLGKR